MNLHIKRYTQIVKCLLWVFLLAIGLSFSMAAQAADNQTTDALSTSPATSPNKGYRYFDLDPGFRMWGGETDAVLGFRLFDHNDTGIWARLGIAYSNNKYYRIPNNGSMYQAIENPGVPALPDSASSYWDFNMFWGFGIRQGLHYDAVKDRDDLNLLISYRGWWDYTDIQNQASSMLAFSAVPERFGNVTHSFQIDLLYQTISDEITQKTKIPDGIRVDASMEYAPGGLSSLSFINFIQYNADFRGYWPLYRETTKDGWNLFSLYLAGHVSVDYIQGLGTDSRQGIPNYVSQRFGGYKYEDGLGGMLRGLGDGYNDGVFKTVGNLELRANLPAMLHPDILLGLVAYIDAGAYANPPGNGSYHSGGFIIGTGFGIAANVLNMQAVAYTNFVLNEGNFKGKNWEPITFEFGWHF